MRLNAHYWVWASTSFTSATDSHFERTRRADLEVCFFHKVIVIITRFLAVCNLFWYEGMDSGDNQL